MAAVRLSRCAALRRRHAPDSQTKEALTMFTGIVLAVGHLTSVRERGGDLELGIDAAGLESGRVGLGDSISVQGACLTVTRKQGACFFADVSRETMAKTTLGKLKAGSHVNLEPSLRAGDALGVLRRLTEDARSRRMEFELPAQLMRFVAPKGSICINGVSLTVNQVEGLRF